MTLENLKQKFENRDIIYVVQQTPFKLDEMQDFVRVYRGPIDDVAFRYEGLDLVADLTFWRFPFDVHPCQVFATEAEAMQQVAVYLKEQR